ncbi:MAG: sugar phosphate isomerase/epimerase [Planctomycetes bacterium]|nr:sugar phosphate isomerase/epimerase [Planctomycetota bacterium]
MKLSFMTFACPSYSIEQVVDTALRLGYHGIEFRIDANHSHGVEVVADKAERKRIRRLLEKNEIEPCCIASSLQFATASVLDELRPKLSLAHDLGCPGVRVFCGPMPPGAKMPDVIDKVGRQLRTAAHLAEEVEVQLWLETHDTMSKAADAAAAVRFVDHPYVGINYDNMHPFRMGEDLETTVAALGSLVRHTHFHDALKNPDVVMIKPLGQGELPMDEMFLALKNMGYTGYLSGEWFGDMYGATADASLKQFRDDMQSLADKHGVTIGK